VLDRARRRFEQEVEEDKETRSAELGTRNSERGIGESPVPRFGTIRHDRTRRRFGRNDLREMVQRVSEPS